MTTKTKEKPSKKGEKKMKEERKTIRGLKSHVHRKMKETAAKYDITIAQAYELAKYCLLWLEKDDPETVKFFLKDIKGELV